MRVLILFLLLSACSYAPVLVHDEWTGARTVVAPNSEVSRSQFAIVEARPVIGLSPTGNDHAVLLNIRRRDANGPKLVQITSQGKLMDYVMHDRLRTHCLDGCQKAEIGAIHLSPHSFQVAARNGLSLRIWGQRDRYAGHIPAQQFQKALAIQRKAQ